MLLSAAGPARSSAAAAIFTVGRADADDRDPRQPLELTDALIAEVREALAGGNPVLAAALAEPLHAADLADLLRAAGRRRGARGAGRARSGAGFDPDTLAYLDEFVRDQVIEALGPEATGEALAQLETDDAVEILAELDAAEQRRSWRPCRCSSGRRSSRAWPSRNTAPAG